VKNSVQIKLQNCHAPNRVIARIPQFEVCKSQATEGVERGFGEKFIHLGQDLKFFAKEKKVKRTWQRLPAQQ
jgi:hypothetical protein